jgi:predicted site-specific integrase-resolvase
MPTAKKPVSTGVAARDLGIGHNTLLRWWNNGDVTPAYVTPGGHPRWDLDELKEQLRDKRKSEQAD